MKRLFKLISLLSVGAVITVGLVAWYQYRYFQETPIAVTPENGLFEITPGSNIRQVAKQLVSQKLIEHELFFLVHARLTGQASQIKAGEYQLEVGMLPDEVLQKFVSGQVVQYPFTILEGKTFKDILADIRKHPNLKQTLGDADGQAIMRQLGAPDGMSPEGWFYPDTYSFPRNTTDLAFLQRSYKAMVTYLQTAWQEREPHPYIKTPYEALILASIVEKETGLPEERPLVARVFLNRLERGMLLQTDPTVIYGMGDKYTGNIRKDDLRTDTPYNTYTRAGLTPTPIATPSKAAIDAVMHPASNSKVLYFVATTPGGASYFSETLAEHNQAVRRYLLNRDKTKEQRP